MMAGYYFLGLALSFFLGLVVRPRSMRARARQWYRDPEESFLLIVEELGREPTLVEWARARQWYKERS